MTEHFSPAAAGRWYQGLFEQMEALSRQPLLCPRAAESEKLAEEVRERLYGRGRSKYRILFAIRKGDVVVLSIQHAARGEWLP
jgi:plasmid stabilization system protein ParE